MHHLLKQFAFGLGASVTTQLLQAIRLPENGFPYRAKLNKSVCWVCFWLFGVVVFTAACSQTRDFCVFLIGVVAVFTGHWS